MPAQVRLLHRILGVSHRPKHAVGETEQAPTVRLELAFGFDIALSAFTGRIATQVARSPSPSAGAARASQSQPTKGHTDEPHHHGDDAPGQPVTGANTTVGSGHD
jgi:hypothetical protein